MESIAVILSMLLAVVFSGWLARLSPVAVPLPLVQIALGSAIAFFSGSAAELDPHVFFLLFLPPLLFLDGWRIPKEGLFRDIGIILELALGLVVFTVLGLGFLIHWMIPSVPLPVAFALAAIVSPTDPVAVSAISARVPVPKRLMHILEGEALLNDASGLVCMRFAVAAVLSASFSPASAVVSFIWVAASGIGMGVGVTLLVTRIKERVTLKVGEEPGIEILVSLLIPFGVYLLAEAVEGSGILAAVAAGVTMSYAEHRGRAMAATRVKRAAVWDTVQFTLNGVIFVLLGEQLPAIIAGAARVVSEAGHSSPIWLGVYVLVLTATLAVLRLVWVSISLRFTSFRANRQGREFVRPGWRLIVATSLAGVRGAITLAGILTLPLALDNGAPFPARDLAIFLAAGVIVTSLLAASIGLPALLRNLELPPEADIQIKEDKARIAGAEAAIREIERLQRSLSEKGYDDEIYSDIGNRIAAFYKERIRNRTEILDDVPQAKDVAKFENMVRLAAIKAERNEIFELRRKREIPDDLARKLVREIDLIETRFTGP
ncbi:Na+/H+ antiporter [Agrobacterium larrymoorei]|uniref:Na+/H+ antiporter n=1 Tax=Agrobacterium larrymoorei TaxID=160699 RepID=A0A4D7E206_9HYPH|nr:Na+/H+ antiporter [Agrobacterium larrymoorei]QCJ00363.1 Na+/H+ antiporter [Agrobacterium larrymoorei]QYA09192.1 Na+/H+ antiporter [Agrobacterium larrymoorei]